MTEITYEELLRTYEAACKGNAEPDLVFIRPSKKTKAIRRRIGRLVRRGLAQRGDIVGEFPFLVIV